jgi:hypothetical protein
MYHGGHGVVVVAGESGRERQQVASPWRSTRRYAHAAEECVEGCFFRDRDGEHKHPQLLGQVAGLDLPRRWVVRVMRRVPVVHAAGVEIVSTNTPSLPLYRGTSLQNIVLDVWRRFLWRSESIRQRL